MGYAWPPPIEFLVRLHAVTKPEGLSFNYLLSQGPPVCLVLLFISVSCPDEAVRPKRVGRYYTLFWLLGDGF